MKLAQELKRTISDFLCTECKSPLYYELESKEEVCANPDCILYPPLLKFHDVSKAKFLRNQMKKRYSNLKLRIMRTDKSSFTRFLYQQRRDVTRELIYKGRAKFDKLLVIDEMLILANSIGIVGRNHSISYFTQVLKDYQQFFKEKNFIEDLENLRVLLSTEDKVYMLKYWNAIMQLYRSYGIIPEGTSDLSNVFKHAEIDSQAKEEVDLRLGMDIGKLFEQKFNLITAFKYVLERYYRTSKQHQYDPTGLDIAVLLGLFFSAKMGDVERWSRESVRLHYERTANGKGDFRDFENQYINSKATTPIIAFDGKSYIFDKETLLFYTLYLIGRNRRKVEGQKATGEETIMKKKQEAAIVFEDYLKKHLRSSGFIVPNEALVISEHNEKYEYDVIGVKEDAKEIVLVEAKYRDFSPSSLTGKTLIEQELLEEENGLFIEAIKHQARLDFLKKYPKRSKRELSVGSSPEKYNVSAWIVTKHLPLISKYRQVQVVVYDEFCEKFRPTGK